MRIVMFGTGPFAVPTFKTLVNSTHDVVALVTRPIPHSGKRRKVSENPTREFGESIGISILDPADINDSDSVKQLEALKADLFVVCDYGQILARACLSASQRGGINLHGSLLPKYRGAAPINWAIYHGETKLGITVIHMTASLDAGPCLTQASLEIGPLETAETVEPQLAELGVQSVLDSIELLAAGDGQSPVGKIQDKKFATNAPRLKKSDGLIDWSRSAEQIVNQIRAFQPWPGTFMNWQPADRKPVRLIVHSAKAVDNHLDAVDVNPGRVALCDKVQLLIQTGSGLLSIETIQPAGKRAMQIDEFLRGQQPVTNDVF